MRYLRPTLYTALQYTEPVTLRHSPRLRRHVSRLGGTSSDLWGRVRPRNAPPPHGAWPQLLVVVFLSPQEILQNLHFMMSQNCEIRRVANDTESSGLNRYRQYTDLQSLIGTIKSLINSLRYTVSESTLVFYSSSVIKGLIVPTRLCILSIAYY